MSDKQTHQPLTDADLAAIRAREQAAPAGPWVWMKFGQLWSLMGFYGGRPVILTANVIPETCDSSHLPLAMIATRGSDGVLREIRPTDPVAEFITHSREDVTALLVEVDRLKADRDRACTESPGASCIVPSATISQCVRSMAGRFGQGSWIGWGSGRRSLIGYAKRWGWTQT